MTCWPYYLISLPADASWGSALRSRRCRRAAVRARRPLREARLRSPAKPR